MPRKPTTARASLAILGVAAAMLTGAGCSPASGQVTVISTGVVVGTFVREGGPIGPNGQQPKELRLPGVIGFVSPGRPVVKVKVGNKGTFSVRMLPGTYSVSGRTPDIEQASPDGSGPGLEVPCSSPLSVKVTRWHTAKITVTCVVP